MITDGRFRLIDCPAQTRLDVFAGEVEAGLADSPKHLPYRFFYDREGSLLFEAISELPEYYLTRAETEILRDRAAELAREFSGKLTLVELGSGSSVKTRILIEALLRRRASLQYIPVDISRTMLEESCRELLRDFPSLEILAIAGEYHDAVRQLEAQLDHRKLILWLGSNVGNLGRAEAAEFLRRIRDSLSPPDRLLVGIDLRKDRPVLQKAYDDSQGITAQFNRNILARINRELGGHFDLDSFQHRAVYDEQLGRVELYLVSSRSQRVAIDRLEREIAFAAGEMLHTENSYKYSLEEIRVLAGSARLALERQWLDHAGRFSANLLAPVG